MVDSSGNMKVLAEEKVKLLVEASGCSPVFAQGYVEGEAHRRRGTLPSKYAQVGIDEYCLGFRAGFYDRKIPGPSRTANPAAPVGRPQPAAAKTAHDTLP